MIITKEAEICLFLNFSTFLVLLHFIDIVKVNKQRIKINSIDYSHSIVPGGLEEISYTILLIPFTLFIILFDTSSKNS